MKYNNVIYWILNNNKKGQHIFKIHSHLFNYGHPLTNQKIENLSHNAKILECLHFNYNESVIMINKA